MKLLLAFACAATLAAQPIDFETLSKQAVEFVRVNLDGDSLRLLGAPGSLRAVRVHAFRFDRDAAPRFTVPGEWSRFMETQSDGEFVQAFTSSDGIVMVVREPRELTVVELPGATQGDLAAFGGQFGLPELEGARPAAHNRNLPDRAAPKLKVKEIAQALESRFGVKRERIPLMGLFGLDLAVFEHVSPAMRQEFHEAVRAQVPAGWTPIIEARERNETSLIYLGGSGSKAQMLIAALEPNEATLLRVKVNMEHLAGEPFQWAGRHRSTKK